MKYSSLILIALFSGVLLFPAVTHAVAGDEADTQSLIDDFDKQLATDNAALDKAAAEAADKAQQAKIEEVSKTIGLDSENNTVPQTPATTSGGGEGTGASAFDAFGPVLGGIMFLFAWLAGAAGVLLNDVVYYTVVKMGDIANPNNLSAVGVAWRVLRDIGNIILIFGFLAVGISTILGYASYGISKRLPTLLVVAVLINFSLFAAEAVIDVGNLFATQFYTQINGGNAIAVQDLSNVLSSQGIAGTVMQELGLQTIYNIQIKDSSTQQYFIGFLGIILFTVLAFVMFALAFVLIARFVALIFLIVVAPVGLAGLVVPKLEDMASKWFTTLIDQAVTAPVLLLLLYIALAVITDANFLSGFHASASGWGATAGGTPATGESVMGFAGILLAFTVAMGLLLACVVAAKQLSPMTASWATKLAGNASFGVVGFAGRRTIGRSSNWAARKVRSSALGRFEMGRGLASVLDKSAKGSFDVRGNKAVADGLKGVGVDAGKAGGKGGYAKTEKDAIEARTKYAETLKLTSSEEAAKAGLEKEIKDMEAEVKNGTKTAEDLKKLKKDINENREIKVKNAFGKEETVKGLNKLNQRPQERYAQRLTMTGANVVGATMQGLGLGAAHAVPLAILGAGAGATAAVGASVGAIGAGAYYAGPSVRANSEAASAIRKKFKENALDKAVKEFKKAAKKEAGGDDKEEEEEEEKR